MSLFLYTDDGKAVVGEIREGNRAYLDGLAEDLGEDLAPITATLEQLVAAIKTQEATSGTNMHAEQRRHATPKHAASPFAPMGKS